MSKQLLLTEEGLKKLIEELKQLKEVKRKENTDRLKKALSYGDLKENFEYQEAKEEQALIESRILDIEDMLKNVEMVVDKKESKTKKESVTVEVGNHVKLRNVTDNDEPVEYYIVGTMEADPLNGKISNESPVGTAVLEKKVGDIVKVATPAGEIEFEILSIK